MDNLREFITRVDSDIIHLLKHASEQTPAPSDGLTQDPGLSNKLGRMYKEYDSIQSIS